MTGRAAARLPLVAAAVLGLGLGACSAPAGSPPPSSRPTPAGATASPSIAPSAALTGAALKARLLDAFGMLWFCDPDFYPVARDDEADLAAKRFPEVQADREAFPVILARLGIPTGPAYDAGQVLAIYREWKALDAIALEPIGNGRFRFDILTTDAPDAAEGRRTAGIIDQLGAITVEQQAKSGPPNCPICLARGSLIETPAGPRAVEDLKVGDPVWTTDASGARGRRDGRSYRQRGRPT